MYVFKTMARTIIRFLRGKPEEVQVQLEQLVEEDGALDHGVAGAQLYEEIRESEMETAAAPSRVTAPATVPQYEDVMPAEKVSKSSDSYHITQCSAYGVALNK